MAPKVENRPSPWAYAPLAGEAEPKAARAKAASEILRDAAGRANRKPSLERISGQLSLSGPVPASPAPRAAPQPRGGTVVANATRQALRASIDGDAMAPSHWNFLGMQLAQHNQDMRNILNESAPIGSGTVWTALLGSRDVSSIAKVADQVAAKRGAGINDKGFALSWGKQRRGGAKDAVSVALVQKKTGMGCILACDLSYCFLGEARATSGGYLVQGAGVLMAHGTSIEGQIYSGGAMLPSLLVTNDGHLAVLRYSESGQHSGFTACLAKTPAEKGECLLVMTGRLHALTNGLRSDTKPAAFELEKISMALNCIAAVGRNLRSRP